MKSLIKIVVLSGLMAVGVAHAELPADISASPGVLRVNWHETSAMDTATASKLEVRNESGDLLASAPVDMKGTQYVPIPTRTQGNLMVSLGDNSSEYRIPYGMGDGRRR